MDKNRELLNNGTYALKANFQALLLPLCKRIIARGYTANQVTVFSAVLCITYALLLVWPESRRLCLLLMPGFLLLRMALNALDGMIAVSTSTSSAVGIVLNETGDILSDLFLFGAFIFLLPTAYWPWLLLIACAVMIEFTSLALFMAVGTRPLLGPFSKSDRALYLGILSLILASNTSNMAFLYFYICVGFTLGLLTIRNRLRLLSKTERPC